MQIDLEKLMSPGEMQGLGVAAMTGEQRQALANWGMRMFMLGQHVVGSIEDINCEGRLIRLDDGTRWEVDGTDASTADLWSPLDRVVVIDDEMFKLDDLEKVAVRELVD